MDAGDPGHPRSCWSRRRRNLVGTGRDLWTYGTGEPSRNRAPTWSGWRRDWASEHAGLKTHVQEAKQATDEFAAWLDARTPSKTGPSGVGVENYDWYLKNVHLVPYTWQEQVVLMERELGRAHTFLALEEQRNRALPQQVPDRERRRSMPAGSGAPSRSTWPS